MTPSIRGEAVGRKPISGMFLDIYKCHWTAPVLVIGDDNETRVLVGKCCVNQYKNRIARFGISVADAKELIDLLEAGVDIAESKSAPARG